jgi:hypothetical protein
MADAYGTVIVCGDYTGDPISIADALNSLTWNNDYVGFRALQGEDKVGLETVNVQYPTVVPEREILEFRDGRRYFADEASETIVTEWEDDGCKSDAEPYSPEQLSNLIAPLLTKGTIELVAVAHEKARCAVFERLIIRSDGYAERHRHFSEIFSTAVPWSIHESEHCDPSTKIILSNDH